MGWCPCSGSSTTRPKRRNFPGRSSIAPRIQALDWGMMVESASLALPGKIIKLSSVKFLMLTQARSWQSWSSVSKMCSVINVEQCTRSLQDFDDSTSYQSSIDQIFLRAPLTCKLVNILLLLWYVDLHWDWHTRQKSESMLIWIFMLVVVPRTPTNRFNPQVASPALLWSCLFPFRTLLRCCQGRCNRHWIESNNENMAKMC